MTTTASAPRPRILLLPGLDGTGALSARFRAALGADPPVTTVHYRQDPHATLADHAAQAEEAAGTVGPVAVIAESFSGAVALELLQRRRIAIARLVLVSAVVTPPWRRLLRGSLLFPGLTSALASRGRRAAAGILLGGHTSEALVAAVEAAARTLPPAVIAARLRLLLQLRPRRIADAPPTLALVGRSDPLVPWSVMLTARELLPHLEVRRLTGPHLLLLTRPRACAQLVRDFLGTR